jgi:hypothetical protein
MINPSVSPQVNNLSAETRNFKTRQREIAFLRFTSFSVDPSLTRRVLIFLIVIAPVILGIMPEPLKET